MNLPQLTKVPGRKTKPAVESSSLAHRQLREDEFWRRIPAWADIDEATFLDHRWQAKHSITRVDALVRVLAGLAPESFVADVRAGFRLAPMAVRVSPYLLSLIDWSNAYTDPLRRQFIPTKSELLPDHP